MHRAAGIPHGVRVFAADKRLLRMLFQKCFNFLYRCVHLAFHVTGGRIASVRPDAFVMYQSSAGKAAEKFAHFIDDFSSVCLIPAGPDQNTCMVLISLVKGIDTVKQQWEIFFMIFRNNLFRCNFSSHQGVPTAMRFHVVLIDHVKSIFIAQPVQCRLVGIV